MTDGPTDPPTGGAGPADPRPADPSAARATRLRHFTPRPRARLGGGRFYSRLVGVSKVVLPILALAGLGVTVWWEQVREITVAEPMRSTDLLAEFGPTDGSGSAAGDEVMNPRFESVDENDNPFELRAEQAVRVEVEDEVMAIESPQADFVTVDGTNVSLVATDGRFDADNDQVMLEGAVELTGDDGTLFLTEAATIDVDAGHAWGDRPITGHGPFGEVEADGFRILDGGRAVVFVGRSRLVLPGAEEGQ